MDSNPPQGYPVTRAQPDDNKNQQYWTGLQAVLAVLARGVPRAVRTLTSLAAGPQNPLSGFVGSISATGASAGFFAYDQTGSPGNRVVIFRDATNFYIQTTEGVSLIFNASTGFAQLGGAGFSGHVSVSGTAPTIAAGTGAGTTPTLTLSGTDNSGKITLTAGTAPAGSFATIATVTFHGGFASLPGTVLLTPLNFNAAGLGASMAFVSSFGTGSFIVTSGTAALTAGNVYVWGYIVL